MKKTTLYFIAGAVLALVAKKTYDENKSAVIDKVETVVKDTVYTQAEKLLHKAVYGCSRTNRVQRPAYESKYNYKTRKREYTFDFFSLKDATDFLKSIKRVALNSKDVNIRDVKVLKGEDFDVYYDEKHGWYNFDSAYIQYVDTWGVYRVVLGPLQF